MASAEPVNAPGPATATPAAGRRRPPVVVAAVLLTIPTAALWLVAGLAFLVVTYRAEGDAKFLLWIIAFAILGLCLLLVFMTLAGMRIVWVGGPNMLRAPAGFTAGLLLVVLGNLLLFGKVEYHPTMLIPMVVGALAGLAVILLATPPARRWLAER
ncbi:hypothetical protein O7621_03980 [Solwaraspora sp. WMMD937]|uniref:hypothetical protein n=1 Tax=Solwaraspora sp. WMMD937 TaxID=3016090 RepID=UPI00249ABB24|nr:hypothetical protein [Solwaraspora sp. WMMD937]WFE22516.1 hypothetical protein O7621_03980 [Solwaraspora sp. WMMD937]